MQINKHCFTKKQVVLNDSRLCLSDIIQQNLEKKLPFCAYKKPNQQLVTIVTQKNNNLNILKDFNQSGFVFAPFNDASETIIFPRESTVIKNFNLAEISIEHKKKSKSFDANLDESKHLKLVNKTISFLKESNAKKVVISRKECVDYPNFDSIKTFKTLVNEYPSAMVYLWYHPKIGLWIGATPELLLQIKNRRFTTMALAGTQKHQVNSTLVWQKKEQEEQQYVTDYICNLLDKHQVSYSKTNPYTEIAGNIAHIRTDISGVLQPSINLSKLISDLHPTPAVCGIPKETAKNFILHNEGYNREFYTGFLGELNKKTFKNRNKRNIENQVYKNSTIETYLFVNLRCMKVTNNTLCFFIGGGITKDSIAINEFKETIEKSKVLKKFIK